MKLLSNGKYTAFIKGGSYHVPKIVTAEDTRLWWSDLVHSTPNDGMIHRSWKFYDIGPLGALLFPGKGIEE
jgi:hypothetical protein